MNFNESVDTIDKTDFEDEQSLLSFFSLLLKIDKRINPKNYEDNRSTNNPY